MSFYINSVKELEKLFNEVNTRWFDGLLETPVITIMSSSKAYGWFYADSWEDVKDADEDQETVKKINELNISPEFLSRSIVDICTTLCHEACHLLAHQTDQQDTSNHGAYHNKVFRDIAEQHHMIVSKHSKASQGWAQTDPDVTFKTWAEQLDYDESAFEHYRNPPAKKKKPSKKLVKYTCPECGKNVKGDENIFVMCKECGKLMLTKAQTQAIENGETTEAEILDGTWTEAKEPDEEG